MSNPQQLNGYAYALNNPVSFSDPSGLSPIAPQPGMIPDWCGGSPVTCTGWHWPDEIGGDSENGGTSSNWSGNGVSGKDAIGWNEWAYGLAGMANCFEDNGWTALPTSSIGISIFGTCLPPLPVDAVHDADAFAFYCFYYGMVDYDGGWTTCSYAAAFAGIEIDTGVDPMSLEEFAQVIADFTIVGDIQDCANGQLSGCAWAVADLFGGKVVKWGADIWSAMRKAQKACNSFIAGTLVLMADGTSKPIEEINPGEEVLSVDIVTGEVVAAIVADTMTTPEQRRNLVTIEIDTDGDGTADGEITATTGHVFWAVAHANQPWTSDFAKWTVGGSLEEGAWLQSSAGTWVQVTSVMSFAELAQTYNLSIPFFHAYFVQAGVSSIVVHNEALCTVVSEQISYAWGKHAPDGYYASIGQTGNAFKEGVTLRDFEMLVNMAAMNGKIVPRPGGDIRDGYLIHYDFGFEIGNGGRTGIEIAVGADGQMVTAYPIHL